jgi:integrase/recombinase XerC
MTREHAELISLGEARLFAEEQLRSREGLTALSSERIFPLWTRFVSFAQAHEVLLLADVAPHLVARFLRARTGTHNLPSIATMHSRRASVRLLFRLLREFGAVAGDPTLDLVLPPRSGLATRPLTDEEVDLCRWAALSSLVATSKPAFWALGEAGASTLEIARVTVADLDVEEGRVWLSGGPRTDARMAPLTDWGAKQLGRRLRSRGCDDPSRLVAFEREVDEHTGRSRAGEVLQAVMGKAGLGGEPDVKPRSLTAWVGSRVLRDTGRIEEAARRLGLRSLDLTAELVGFEWRAVTSEEE